MPRVPLAELPEAERERIRAANRASYRRNRKAVLAKVKTYNEQHKNDKAAYDRTYRQDNKDRLQAQQTVRRAANPEQLRILSRGWTSRRRMRVTVCMTAEDKLLSAEYRKAIRYDPCHYCGGPGEHDDHAFPLALGGTDHWWNLVRACSRCNLSKGPHCMTWFLIKHFEGEDGR